MLAAPLQPHDITLPRFPPVQLTRNTSAQQSPREIAQSWLDRFSAVLASGDASRLKTVLHEDSWWRDHVALSWDLRTLHGLPAITSFLSPILSSVNLQPLSLAKEGEAYAPSIVKLPELEWIQSIFSFETSTGRGRGFLRLARDETGDWKAHMLYTALDEIKSHEESTGARRSHGGHRIRTHCSSHRSWTSWPQSRRSIASTGNLYPHRRQTSSCGRQLALSLSHSGNTRSSDLCTHVLPPIPIQLAPVHAQRQIR
jgi:hypothetical protein